MERKMYVPLVKLTMVEEKEVPYDVSDIGSPVKKQHWQNGFYQELAENTFWPYL